ncbi:MAG: protein kinase domain-containing protein [Polyangiaceae bacterium]|jgi:eukaryotic-like serine/threonine-protein kinase
MPPESKPPIEPSPLARTGVGHDDVRVTVGDSPGARGVGVGGVATPGSVEREEDLDDAEGRGSRYTLRDRLGEGGMGEVYLCADHRIGRDIAMKVIRAGRGSSPDARTRFLREARVQGQLEHPSIVPVYDLGRDANGSTYFTMRRLRGKTFEQVIDELRGGVQTTIREWTRHKLLTAFSSVCLAIDFAHSRGVVHRDLKPDNVMLGDFGEVYVLDWGLAKVVEDATAPESERQRAVTPDPADATAPRTAFGAVMGTPGYMAPEQAAGDGPPLDARTDVYALGALLFEILALTPLHARGTSEQVMRATLEGVDARASVRAPTRDIAPELDAICVRATAVRREDRFTSARELYEAIENFLSGDRDVERRRALAREHASAAALATDRALAGGADAAVERTRAMREVSRAVALDPANTDAMRSLVRLFTEPPREIPREARDDLSRALVHSQRAAARAASIGYLSWLAYAPLALWMGVRQVGWGALCDVLFLAAAAANAYVASARETRVRRAADVALVVSSLAIVSSTGVVGPFMLLPGIAAVNTILYVGTADRTRRLWAIAAGCLVVAAAFSLQVSGLLPAALSFEGGALVTLPQIVAFPRIPTLVFLLTTNIAVIVTASLFVARSRDALHATQEQLYFHTWQLRQFVPGEAYGAVATRSIAPPAVTSLR